MVGIGWASAQQQTRLIFGVEQVGDQAPPTSPCPECCSASSALEESLWVPLFDCQGAAVTLDYGFIYLRNRTLAPAARRFMAIVREIEAEPDVRNRRLIRQIVANSELAPGEAG